MQSKRVVFNFLVIGFLSSMLVITGCGGGGGSGTTLNYTGNSNPATVTTTNAAAIAGNLFGIGDSGKFLALSTDSSVTKGVANTGYDADKSVISIPELMEVFEATATQYLRNSQRQGFSIQENIDETLSCDTGSYRIYGTVNNNYTGTVTMDFSSCVQQGISIDGSLSLSINSFDTTNFVTTDATYKMVAIIISAGTDSFTLDGSIRMQSSLVNNTVTLTQNIVTDDTLSGAQVYAKDLVMVSTFDDVQFPTTVSVAFNGSVYDSIHGYVDIVTITPFVYNNIDDLYPSSGYLTMTGDNSGLAIEAVDSSSVTLHIDEDGNGNYETSQTMLWTQLG
jgi:hypothetical protein